MRQLCFCVDLQDVAVGGDGDLLICFAASVRELAQTIAKVDNHSGQGLFLILFCPRQHSFPPLAQQFHKRTIQSRQVGPHQWVDNLRIALTLRNLLQKLHQKSLLLT